MHVSAAGRDLDPPAGFSVPYALRTLIDELTLPPVVIRDGEAVEIEPLAPGGVGRLRRPDRRGRDDPTRCTPRCSPSATASAAARRSFRLSLHADLLERLRELADASDEEIARAARRGAAAVGADTVSVHLVEAAGGGAQRARALGDDAGRGPRGRRRRGLDRGAGRGRRAAARARRDHGSAASIRPSAASTPTSMFAELEQRGSEFDVRGRARRRGA